MFMVILLAALSTVAIAATIAALRTDGYRRTPTDWSRLPDRPSSADAPPTGSPAREVDASRRTPAARDLGRPLEVSGAHR